MNRFKTTVAVALAAVVIVTGQTPAESKLPSQLKRVFPAATSFSPKEGNPPHFKAYVADPKTRQQILAGYAFWTTEVEPLERGYDGPIKMMVGMDSSGVLIGVLVVDHHEPYGNVSGGTDLGKPHAKAARKKVPSERV
jgi:NosR/NirI family nitrous oxide reductase transcriptional regulator